MSTLRWIGNAASVKQVTTATPANVEIGDIFALIINGKSISYTATDILVATVVDALVDLWNASAFDEFLEVTATASGGTLITLEAKTAGVPFTVTATATDGGGADTQTFVIATTTAATGPNHWDNLNNWSGGAIPVNADDVVFDLGSIDVLYGLDQSSVTLTSLTRNQSYGGRVGLPLTNIEGYNEYRATELAISATTISIGEGDGPGSGRFNINTGSIQTTINVSESGQPEIDGIPSIQWRGTHASNVINIKKGVFGAAFYADQVATIASLNVGFLDNQSGDSIVYCGSGVTLTTIEQTGGLLTVNSAATTVDIKGGTFIFNVGALTTLTIEEGSVLYRSIGTITTANVGSNGNLDFRQDQRSRTITNLIVHEGFAYHDPYNTVTLTNGIDFTHCSPASGVFDVADHLTWTPSSI